jgi:hypothetical protein
MRTEGLVGGEEAIPILIATPRRAVLRGIASSSGVLEWMQ